MTNYLKVAVAIILLACIIDCDSSETVHSEIVSYGFKEHYCGELLILALKTVCVEPLRSPIGDIEVKVNKRKKNYKYLINHCCIKPCSMDFIKANCPGTPEKIANTNISTKDIRVKPATTILVHS